MCEIGLEAPSLTSFQERTRRIDLSPNTRSGTECHFNFRSGIKMTKPCYLPEANKLSTARTRFYYYMVSWVAAVKGHGDETRTANGAEAICPLPTISELQPGDWVEVRSIEEIEGTLNHSGSSGGLRFMPEMRKFCGRRFRVFRRVGKVMLETTGELRTITKPTYYLEGVYCDGEFHANCERTCFLLWRESWLKKVPPPDDAGT